MIKVNGEEIVVEHFSDGTQKLSDVMCSEHAGTTDFVVEWHYENDAELVTLQFIVMHIRDTYNCLRIDLFMPYVPNARMDRVERPYNEVFTLKHFAAIINSLHFNSVYIIDAHSRVTSALLDRCIDIDSIDDIHEAIIDVRKDSDDDIVLFFPDKGSMDRYAKKVKALGYDFKVTYGVKTRDWETAKISKYDIVSDSGENVNAILLGKKVMIIDDIISSGGTIEHAIERLRGNGVESIYIYCTHFENNKSTIEKLSKWSKYDGVSTMDKILKRIYTTDSVFRLDNVNMKCIDLFNVSTQDCKFRNEFCYRNGKDSNSAT